MIKSTKLAQMSDAGLLNKLNETRVRLKLLLELEPSSPQKGALMLLIDRLRAEIQKRNQDRQQKRLLLD